MEICKFEIAKKLKEKGFPQHITEDAYIIDNYGEDEYQIGDRLPIPLIPDYMDDIAAPTISQVLKWLREEKKIHICVDFDGDMNWYYQIAIYGSTNIAADGYGFKLYEDAMLAGIDSVFNNLI